MLSTNLSQKHFAQILSRVDQQLVASENTGKPFPVGRNKQLSYGRCSEFTFLLFNSTLESQCFVHCPTPKHTQRLCPRQVSKRLVTCNPRVGSVAQSAAGNAHGALLQHTQLPLGKLTCTSVTTLPISAALSFDTSNRSMLEIAPVLQVPISQAVSAVQVRQGELPRARRVLPRCPSIAEMEKTRMEDSTSHRKHTGTPQQQGVQLFTLCL